MTTEELQDTLNRLGVVRFNGANVAVCQLCQPEETEPDKFKLYVNAGKSLPVVLFCMRCCIPKARYPEDKKHNADVVQANIIAVGIKTDLFYAHLNQSDIEQLWANLEYNSHQSQEERATDHVLDFCYTNLLDSLTLNDRHRRWLIKRGLDPNWCYDQKYRSTPTQLQSWKLANLLYQSKGRAFCANVPGLTEDRWLTRDGALLIPCRDESGRIGAVKQRLMHDGHARMRLLSGNGPKAKQMLHYPFGSKLVKGQPLWITEGERKADSIYYNMGNSVVGVPGTGSISQCLEPSLRAGSVVLAFDKDEAGAKAGIALARSLVGNGVKVGLARWGQNYRKIDDAIAKGQAIEVVGVDLSLLSSSQQQKSQKSYQKSLDEAGVLAYIREKGPLLRQQVVCHPALISKLITEDKIKMYKTKSGQVLEIK